MQTAVISVFNDVDGGGDDYCSFILGHFFFLSFFFPSVCSFKGLIGPEWLEAERRDLFAKSFSYQSTRSRSVPRTRRRHFLSLTFTLMLQFVKAEERKTTHTRGLEKGRDGDNARSRQLVVPNLTLFFSFSHNDTLSFLLFYFQFLIRQIFL